MRLAWRRPPRIREGVRPRSAKNRCVWRANGGKGRRVSGSSARAGGAASDVSVCAIACVGRNPRIRSAAEARFTARRCTGIRDLEIADPSHVVCGARGKIRCSSQIPELGVGAHYRPDAGAIVQPARRTETIAWQRLALPRHATRAGNPAAIPIAACRGSRLGGGYMLRHRIFFASIRRTWGEPIQRRAG